MTLETAFEGEPILISEYPKLKAKRNSKGIVQLLYGFDDFDRNDPYCGFGNDSGGGWRLEPPHFVLENGVGGCFVNYFESLPFSCQYDIDDWGGNDLFLTTEECTRHLDQNTLQAVNQLSIVDATDFLFFAWQRNRYEKSVKDLLLSSSNRRHSKTKEQNGYGWHTPVLANTRMYAGQFYRTDFSGDDAVNFKATPEQDGIYRAQDNYPDTLRIISTPAEQSFLVTRSDLSTYTFNNDPDADPLNVRRVGFFVNLDHGR